MYHSRRLLLHRRNLPQEGGRFWPPSYRDFPAHMSSCDGPRSEGSSRRTTGLPTRIHKASAREVLTAAVQPFWSSETEPKEVILYNFQIQLSNAGAVTFRTFARPWQRYEMSSYMQFLLWRALLYHTACRGSTTIRPSDPMGNSRCRCFGS